MEIRLRPTSSREDEELSLELYNEVWPRTAATMAEVDSFKRSLRAYADIVAFLDAEPAASGFAALQPQRPNVGNLMITVLPRHRRRGVGTELYRALSQWCAEHSLEEIETRVEEDDEQSLEYAARRGFVEVEHEGRMVLELDGLELPPIAPPPGVEIVTWADRGNLAPGIYEVAVQAYADVPGAEHEEMEPFEDWLEHDMRGAADRPEATFVALAGDEVVGYAKFHLTAARPTVAFHDMTGVKRAWRGRGIAVALKRAQIDWAK